MTKIVFAIMLGLLVFNLAAVAHDTQPQTLEERVDEIEEYLEEWKDYIAEKEDRAFRLTVVAVVLFVILILTWIFISIKLWTIG